MIEPGTYNETLNVTEQVTLESDPALSGSAANTILNAAGYSNGIAIMGANASGTVIKGLTIENSNNEGIFVQNSNNVSILNNIVTKTGLTPNSKINEDKGIELIGTAHGLVANNTLTDNGGGIGLADNGAINPGAPAPAGTAAPSFANVLRNNTISINKHACGIVVAAYNPGEGVIDNTVVGNNVSLSPAGIVVAADVPGTTAQGNSVIDNTSSNNFLPGIILHSNTPGDVVTNNSIIGNTLSGNKADPEVKADAGPTGIIAIGAVDPVTHTLIAGNMISNETYGIYLANSPGVLGLTGNQFASTVQIPITPSTPQTIFPLLPMQVNTGHHVAYFYAGVWPGKAGMVAIAKYSANGQLISVYSQPYSSTLSSHIGSMADGTYLGAGHYTIPLS